MTDSAHERMAAALVAFLLPILACAGPAWDAERLAERYPALRAVEAHRLGDTHPYVLARFGRVLLFLCRWSTEAPIGVSFPAEATREERRAFEAALRGWEGAGLGLRLRPVLPAEASIRLELEEGPVETAAGKGAARTVVDCAVAPESGVDPRADVLRAEILGARVVLSRRAAFAGRDRPLSPEELAGAAVHELGHALGYQGHVGAGETPMVAAPEVARRFGARVLAGGAVDAPSLRALYALPSGVVVASATTAPWRTQLADRMFALAREANLAGPFARVGDAAARLFWRDREGREYGLQVVNLEETLTDPSNVLLVAETLTRRALPRSRDSRAPRR